MPGLKRTVYEFCPKCGERDARLRDDGMLAWGIHFCRLGYQGRPHDPPHLDRPDSVYFVPNNDPVFDARIVERERCTEVLHQLTHRITEYLYGATREQAVEWAKSDKYDSTSLQAIDILDICKHAINGN
jgi:hypothetical protein